MKIKRIDISLGGSKIVIFNEKDAIRLGLKPYDRVKVVSESGKSITASVSITRTFINEGEIGVLKEVGESLGVKEGDEVKVVLAPHPASWQFIRKKLKGNKLTRDEIYYIIRDVVSGELSELEIAAFLLAEYFHGMSIDEIVYMIEAMVETGVRIEFEETVYDIHSIGGVPGNSKVALIEVPVVAATGLLIPKTSSRAITSPAGTADTMEVLANVSFKADEIREMALKARGLICWGGILGLAPADDIFIKVEHPLQIDPPSQMIASILAKKVAMGVKYLVIDIPTGKGTKAPTREYSEKLARLFLDVSEKLNITLRCAITYGGQPIGYSAGPALEAREAIEALQNKRGAMSVIDKALSLAGLIFEMAGLEAKGKGYDLAKEIFRSGKAWEKMKQIIEVQGGDPNIKPEDIPVGGKRIRIESPVDSYVTHVDNTAITLIARAAGAPIDKGAGVAIFVKAGHKVKKGDPLIEIYAERESKLTEAYNLALKLKPVTLEGMLLKTIP